MKKYDKIVRFGVKECFLILYICEKNGETS
jgi:hypothetical protein